MITTKKVFVIKSLGYDDSFISRLTPDGLPYWSSMDAYIFSTEESAEKAMKFLESIGVFSCEVCPVEIHGKFHDPSVADAIWSTSDEVSD